MDTSKFAILSASVPDPCHPDCRLVTVTVEHRRRGWEQETHNGFSGQGLSWGIEDLCVPTRGHEHSLITVKPGFQGRKYFMVTQHTRVTLVPLGVGLNIGQVARRSDYFYKG